MYSLQRLLPLKLLFVSGGSSQLAERTFRQKAIELIHGQPVDGSPVRTDRQWMFVAVLDGSKRANGLGYGRESGRQLYLQCPAIICSSAYQISGKIATRCREIHVASIMTLGASFNGTHAKCLATSTVTQSFFVYVSRDTHLLPHKSKMTGG